MSDERLLVLRGSGASVWHYPSDDDGSMPACRCGTHGAAYKRLRPEIARDWYDECTLCAGERSLGGGQGGTALPTQTEVPTDG